MSKQFDELSRNLGGGMSRRRALGSFLAAIGGAVLLGKNASANGNEACEEFCRSLTFDKPRYYGECVAVSAKCPPGVCAVVNDDPANPFVCQAA